MYETSGLQQSVLNQQELDDGAQLRSIGRNHLEFEQYLLVRAR